MVSKSLRTAIAKFNSQRPSSRRVTWDGITQLGANQPGCIPQSIQHKAVRLHHSVARATEEKFQILAEMRNTVQHYLGKISLLQMAIEGHTLKESDYDRGEHSLLHAKKRSCVDELVRLSNFEKFDEFPELCQFLQSLGSSLSQDEQSSDMQERTSDTDLESIGSASHLSDYEEDELSEDDESDHTATHDTTCEDQWNISDSEMYPSESTFDTSERPTVRPTQTERSAERALRPTQTERSTERTVRPTQPERSTERALRPTQTERSTGRTVRPTQTERSAERTLRPTQTERSTERTVRPTQTERSAERTVRPTQTERTVRPEKERYSMQSENIAKSLEEECSSGDSGGEEMEVQTWRKEKLFRDEYMESTRVCATC